jgi:hypothetical protein
MAGASPRKPSTAPNTCQRFFSMKTFSLLAAWHPRSQADPAHVWLRERLSDIVRALNRSSPAQAEHEPTMIDF